MRWGKRQLYVAAYGFLIRERAVPPLRPGNRKSLTFPIIRDPVAPPIRQEHCAESSIATIREMLVAALGDGAGQSFSAGGSLARGKFE
jgi:hypothetical protein